MRYITIVSILLLSGCTMLSDEFESFQDFIEKPSQETKVFPATNESYFHTHVEDLARQLFDTSNEINPNQSLIVGTFLPADKLMQPETHQIGLFGIQLQESFTTFSTQAGLDVIEYKSMSGVMVTDTADIMLSRDIEKLDKNFNAQYLLTGNYVEQENYILVNVKLINIVDKRLVSAATGSVPLDSFFSDSKVKLKNGMLYRAQR